MSQSIKVIVRIRPLNSKQLARGCKSIVAVDHEHNQINLTKPEQTDNIKSFAFDAAFAQDSEQAHVYSKAAYSLVEHVLEGYNGTVFAYGQTGCGKTHSMVGQPDNETHQGIIPRCFGHVLKSISDTPNKQFLLRCSFLEIYNQEIHDLLGDPKARMELKQSPDKGVFVKDISQKQVKTQQELMQYLNQGNKNRAVGETAMNKDSSRSHLLFTLYLQSAEGGEQDKRYVASRLNLVDLAGSERLGKTGATGDRLKEAQKINLSLSALGNVISALVEGRSQHIPYRDSKLTRLLQDSLGGNTKTVMLANCSPADYNFEQTLSTLRYAARAKMIKNKPIINQDPKDALLKQYAQQIQKLRKQVEDGGVVQGDGELHDKLKQKQAELLNQKNEKVQLMRKIRQLQSKHIEGRNVRVDPKVVENMRRISLLAGESKKKKTSIRLQLSQELDEEMQKNQGPGIFNNLNLGSPNKTTKGVDGKKLKQFRSKVKQLQRQVRDLGHENYHEKECLLQDIRDLTKQNKFLQNVLGMLLQTTQVEDIRNSSTYNQEKGQYHVPPFYVKNKQLVFPKLNKEQSIDMIKQMHNRRQVMVEEKQNYKTRDKSNWSKGLQRKGSKEFHVNGVLRDARGEDHLSLLPTHNLPSLKTNFSKIKLQPLLKS